MPHALLRTPVAQDLRIGCGLACKDNALALLYRLRLDGQGHCGRVYKAGDRKSGSFLYRGFPFLSLAHPLGHHVQ